MRPDLHCVLAVSFVLLVGCGGDSKLPDLGQVSGRVTVGGQPVTNAIILFNPTEKGRPSSAEVGSDGQYELKYDTKNKGAILGEHAVTLQAIQPDNVEVNDKDKPAFPKEAMNGSKKVTVAAGKQTLDIEF